MQRYAGETYLIAGNIHKTSLLFMLFLKVDQMSDVVIETRDNFSDEQINNIA